MKIAMLSRTPRSYTARRFRDAALKRGHKFSVLDTSACSIVLEREQPAIFYKGKEVKPYDAVIPRIGSSITYYGSAIVQQFQQTGVFCLNNAQGILASRDKLRSLQILSRHDIGIPKSSYVRERGDIVPSIERVGGAPVIIKLLEGTQGVGVILAESMKVAEAIIETLQSAKQNVLIQKFVAESRGRDVRALVVGDQVVAAMRRVAQGQEFRSNVHRGGKPEALELDPAYRETAVRAAHILGLRVAGVDMLEGADGPQVMEVNSSPGLAGIESATKVDVAGAILDFLGDVVDFPELDLRERLTVSKGYGVAELYVAEGSEMAGKPLSESGLAERDIAIVKLQRGDKLIPNPKATRALRAGDKLLCFGKLESMRAMLPPRKRHKRKPLSELELAPVSQVEGEPPFSDTPESREASHDGEEP